jgi:hypothetical protein
MSQNLREYEDDDPDKPKTERELGFLTEIDRQVHGLLGRDLPPPEVTLD